MTFLLVNRVRETTISPGTGTATLAGAALGYQTFSAGVGANNTTYYVIADQSGANWEVGYGTVGAGGTTLARTTVLSSSNAGSLVNFSSGTQDVWVDYPANKAVFQDSTGTVSVPVLLTTSTTSTTPNLSFNASNTPLSAGASISGSYLQAILQNKSGTAGASINYVLSNDLGTDSTYYGEFGMNSSVYSSGTPTDFYSINNGIYFSGHDGDITFGSGNGFKSYFAWGSSGQSAHVINASGALGFSTNLGTTPALSGTTGYGTAGQVPVSAGSTGAVSWSSTPTLTGTNFTGVPISTAISGLGTGVATALAVAVGSAGAFVVNGGALGTPSSGTLTNTTGFPAANLAGTALASAIVTSSLTSVGTIGTGVWQGTTIGAVYGGTGQSTVTTGDLLYGSATNTWSKLGIGSTGTILRVVAGIPAWGTDYTGTVTSVAQSFTGGLISVSGSPITTSGTLALTVAGTSGGIPYFSSASTWATSAVLTANALMIGGGAAVAPSTITTGTGVVTALGVAVGSAGAFVVNGGALGTPSSGTLTNCTFPTLNQNTTGTASNVTGTVAVANGGTGLTTTPANGALDIGNGSGFTRATLTAGNYISITNGAGSISIANTAVYQASYMIVAGGGGGTLNVAGGGAGGMITGTTAVLVGTAYGVIIGAGGPASTSPPNGNGGASTAFNLTAVGGGSGAVGSNPGQAGGSGGGGSDANNGAGAGTSGQGNAGGVGTGSGGGGGGGAGAAGTAAGSSQGGAGGVGLTTSLITTTQATSASVGQVSGGSTYFAGGGGGAWNTGGKAGGLGGGGAGANGTTATAGTANTGGGGGGAYSAAGASGGSGCVIISVPTANYSGVTTGSPTVVTNGSNTVMIFKSAGSYTA